MTTLRIIREQPLPPGASIQERFEAFHRANPWVYDSLVELARELRAQGHRKLGINMLWEVTRWRLYRSTPAADLNSAFKFNDHYPSRYVRLITASEPDLADSFEVRRLRA